MKSNKKGSYLQRLFSGKSGKKNAFIALSLVVIALVGLSVLFSHSSSFIVSPFLLARSNGFMREGVPVIKTAPSSATIGSAVTITGTGFGVSQVYVGAERMRQAKSFENGTKIVFELPRSSRLPAGMYRMHVRNIRGKSSEVPIQIVSEVPSSSTPAPTPACYAAVPQGQYGCFLMCATKRVMCVDPGVTRGNGY